MFTFILSTISSWIIAVISIFGYAGVLLLSLLESAGIPIPSEIIVPFSGFLVFQQKFIFWLVVLAATIGNILGSLIAWWIGKKGGRPLIERYGKYILLSKRDLDLTEKWFQRKGSLTVFIGRLIPIVRTYISFPAGIAKMPILPFVIYSFAGALIWSWLLGYIGFALGEHWREIGNWLHKFDLIIVLGIIAGIAYWIKRHLKRS